MEIINIKCKSPHKNKKSRFLYDYQNKISTTKVKSKIIYFELIIFEFHINVNDQV